jgi:type VI secretion system protein ImpJ
LFEHWLRVRETSPEVLYTALRTLSGELATFVRASTRRPQSHPAYQHIDPYLSFRELMGDVQALLNDVLVRSAQSIPLANRANGVRVASVEPSELQGFSSLVFAVAAHTPPDQLASQFPARCKVGPAIGSRNSFGRTCRAFRCRRCPCRHARFLSMRALSISRSIRADRCGSTWSSTAAWRCTWRASFPGLRMELWGVREK